MAFTFNVPSGETIAREMLIAYLNTGTESAPVWSPIGKRVEDSSLELDWSEESKQDILGNTYTSMKKPIVTQSFDPWELEGGDAAQQKIIELAFVQQNAQALTNLDMLIGHWYLTDGGTAAASFSERYKSCMVKPSSLGGEGGGNLSMGIDVTYGGERSVGTVAKDGGSVSFVVGGGVD